MIDKRLVAALLLSTLAAPPVSRAERANPRPGASLRAADLLTLKKRFGRFSDSLPDVSQLGMGKILAYEENRFFVFVMGNGGAVLRRVVFLKPATFVVDDQVCGPARWRLHASKAPDVKGRRVQIAEGDARILCEALLPKDAAVTTSRGGDHVVEVAPRGKTDEVRFLHVLHVGGKDSPVPKWDLSAKAGVLRVKVAAGGRTCELTLPPGPARTGTIAVAGADGKAILEKRLLPAGILPHGEKGVAMLERWDRPYRHGRRPGWGTGRPATELIKAVEAGTIRPGRAIVLGCGTGTNPVYLARKGFDVTAVDLAPAALIHAEAKARKAGVRVRWLVADVLAMPPLKPFDFLFDRGCYHHVRRYNAAGFVEMARRLTHPGSQFLILAGSAKETRRYGPPRVKESEIRGDFSALFDFQHLRDIRFDTRNPGGKGPMAWSILLRRKDETKPSSKKPL